VQIKIFNDILDQFFDYMETNFPLFKSDIILTRTTTDFIRKSNPRLVVEQFYKFVSPYKTQLFKCDEDFFLNFEENLSGSLSSENILEGMKIKNMWLSSDTTTYQKAYIWLYFQKLLQVSEKLNL